MIGALVEAVALYRPNGYDIGSEFQPDTSEISRQYGKCYIAGNNANYLNQELQGKGYILSRRFCYWEYQPAVWVVCMAVGDSSEKFNEALAILANIKKLRLIK